MQFPKNLQQKLNTRLDQGTYRRLKTSQAQIDFCSNDYLGLARSAALKRLVALEAEQFSDYLMGATGSRLLSGNHPVYELLEAQLATFHQAEAALLFNSGYVANLGIFSAVPQRGDTIFYDEASHASIKEGIRLSLAKAYSFKHNSLEDLSRKFKHATGNAYIAVESIYSMDGDQAPLLDLTAFCEEKGAYLIVDEAHSNGLFGPNGEGLVVEQKLANKVFARIMTFGKAIGSHGAVVVGSVALREYLINFSRPFIYSTALPLHTILAIKGAYSFLPSLQAERQHVKALSGYLNQKIAAATGIFLKNSGPINGIFQNNVAQLKKISEQLQQNNIDVRPVFSPTVPAGKERLRVIIHAFNTQEQVDSLLQHLIF
ncbi:aminotransferase class I/II-fold pyridoxal phosphate-dependent enzyme [Adhaeribacter pallidiroseus]|uniref:8-amino-7-oxononanoate synthase n=1 Tax=Adhaeribacter pallidiroseus TaxID=2072847 RepID=A0A369QJK0_9BACT|nr:8-amino-7-oxononanoate synthase [Adhaeribacter pallidiroseus]RDC62448.1 8-amino-7-oxononanoate synthase [Adhaeribacter pallidiroseus]